MNFRQKMNSYVKGNGFMSFLTRYWWLLLVFIGVAMLIPVLIRYFKRQRVKNDNSHLQNQVLQNNAENSTADPVKIAIKTATIRKKYPNVPNEKLLEIKTNAQRISNALGTNVQDSHVIWGFVELFNVWTEDEDEVVKIAKKHTGTFPILEEFYYHLFTNSRNLKHDLLKYLSASDLEKIRASHIKYGGFKHI